MPSIVIVQSVGTLKNLNVGTWNENDLYKKAGFKSPNGFEHHTDFKVKSAIVPNAIVSLYGKTNGRANTENKYDFPPPMDNTLFFGNCVLVMKDATTHEVKDMTVELWNKIYEALFGGFEDLSIGGKMGSVCADLIDKIMDEREIDEEEKRILNDPKTEFTKSGYIKDDFIVDDEEESVEHDTQDNDEEEEYSPPKTKKKGSGSGSRVGKKESSSSLEPSPVNPFHEQQSKKGKMKTITNNKARKSIKSSGNSQRSKGTGTVGTSSSSVSNTEYECKDELTEEPYYTEADQDTTTV